MINSEKVIKGLECCISDRCHTCSYDINIDCPGFEPTPKTLLQDALELLKAQEARVMTVDEMNQLSNGDTVWVELSDGRLLPTMVEDGTLMRWGYTWRICDEAFCAHEEGECAARVWTSRPTDEQREAVKWDG